MNPARIRVVDKGATLEELLATDDLFIQYFNAFLALPSFPEPLFFNKETGGFEVLNDAKHALAKEIKEAVRAGRRRRKIYRPVRNHSYSTIPLIPMMQPALVEEKEIDTSFTVQTLNKEQGIEWIKAQRLPAFLNSDFYIEFRLARILSQVQTDQCELQERGSGVSELFTMKIDYTSPQAKEALEEAEPEEEEDEAEVMMRDLYVSMGKASSTTTEAWVSQAKSALDTTTTTSSVRPTPSLTNSYPSSRPTSSRPHSGRPHRDASQSCRVGFLLPDSYRTTQDQDNADQTTHVHKPMTSRSEDELCVVAEKLEEGTRGGVVYSSPRSPTTESEESDDDKDDRSVQSETSKDSVMDEGDDTPIVFHSVDELGAVIVGTVLKEALAEATGQAEESIRTMPHIQQLYPSAKYHHFTKATLERVECLLDDKSTHSTKVQESLPPPLIPERSTETRKLNPKDEDSDDSLLNSDDDYEEDRDSFFRKTKNKKTYSLLTRKGFEQFKTFLEGSVGQKNWTLWVDIERAKLIEDPDDQKMYLAALRDCYDKKGSQLELSGETKRELGLTEPSHWNLDTLTVAQTRMAEPLLLYWAPRFLIQQTSHVEPDKHYLYHHQRLIQPHPHPYPNPPVIKVLPLRPKTCMPRMGVPSSTSPRPSNSPIPLVPHMLDSAQESGREQLLPTAPPTGMKRTYSLPDMYVKAQQNIPITQEPVKRDPVKRIRAASAQPRRKTPKELITARMSVTPRRTRPPSAPGLMSSKRLSSGSGANSSTEELWERTSSVSQQDSLHHTTDQPDDASEAMARRSSTASDVYSEVSTFAGGRRMEGLLQALAAEKTAGGFLRKSLLAHDNQLWLRCLDFWQELQQYHQIFYAPVLNPYKLQNKAKHLYSTYIVRGAPQSVACSQPIADDIHLHIDPPYEELFDAAEEHVLSELYEAWTQSLSADLGLFGKVELVEVRRHLEAKSKYVVSLQQRGIIKERVETIEDPMEGYQDPVYDDTLSERIPREFIDFTLEKLIHNRMELEHFRQFLADHYASMDLMCWMDLEAFRRTPHTEEKRREARAKDIRVKYLNKKYFFGPNSPAGKEGQEKVMSVGGGWGKLLDDRPPTSSLLEAQKYVRQRLEKKWMPLFLATEGFADRQRPQSGMDDVVEDVLIQRKKKSQAIWKMLESKWVSSSKDILTFRKALGNPVTSLQFRKFVSIKGDHFENDVLFWQEVQKYKELCHLHSDRSLVHQKTSNLINCFIDSPIPPSLQIDITQEMAEKVLDRKLEATPYLFRESQLTVFRVLFSHWSDFCIYRSQLADDKVIPTLERHRRKARAEEKRKQKDQEERKEREAARRQQLGLPPDGDHTENQYDPFGGRGGSDGEEEGDGEEGGKHKDAVSWSYSQYMEALDQEEVLNETNTSTFSSLMEVKQQLEAVSQTHVSPADSGSEEGEGSKEASSGKRSIKRKALNGVEKGQVPTSDTGSQTDPKPKKTVRVISPKSKQPTPDDVSRSSSPPTQKSPAFLPSPPNADKPTHTRRRNSATDSRK